MAHRSKVRPVLVVQSDIYNAKIHNLIVAGITSNLKNAADPANLLIDVSTPDGKTTGLLKNSVISCINLYTITNTRVSKKIDELTPVLQQQVDDCLKAALELP